MGPRSDRVEIRRSLTNASIATVGVGLLWFGDWSTRFTAATVKAIQWISRPWGGDAVLVDGTLHWDGLKLAWTEDCSGVQALFILFGMTAWACFRTSPLSFLRKILLTVPAAVLANLMRVMAIAALRFCFYPRWEGETFHFALGLLSVLPFVVIIAREKAKDAQLGVPWLIYLVSILAACSTRLNDTGGVFVLLSTVGYLLGFDHHHPLHRQHSWWSLAAWLAAGLGIAGLRAESLWLPWLLICPPLINQQRARTPETWLFLVGTIPMIAAHTGTQVIVVLAVLWRTLGRQTDRRYQDNASEHFPQGVRPHAGMFPLVAVAAAFLIPMVGEMSWTSTDSHLRPPSGFMKLAVDDQTYRLRTIGQPSDIAAFWHASHRQGRHHSIATCLRFRGIATKSLSNTPGAMHSESAWLREWFILDGKLYDSYLGYVTRCFPPFTSHGVHVVLQASKATTSRDHFLKESARIAKLLHRSHLRDKAVQGDSGVLPL